MSWGTKTLPRPAEHQKADIFSTLSLAVAVGHNRRRAGGKQKSPPGVAVVAASTAAAARREEGQTGGTAPRRTPRRRPVPALPSPCSGYVTAAGLGGLLTLRERTASPKGKQRGTTRQTAASLQCWGVVLSSKLSTPGKAATLHNVVRNRELSRRQLECQGERETREEGAASPQPAGTGVPGQAGRHALTGGLALQRLPFSWQLSLARCPSLRPGATLLLRAGRDALGLSAFQTGSKTTQGD